MSTCSPTQLLSDGKCFACLNKRQAQIVMAQLLCGVLDALGPSEVVCSALYRDSFQGPDGQPLDGSIWRSSLDLFLYSGNKAVDDPEAADSDAYVRDFAMRNGYVQARTWGEGWHEVDLRFSFDVAAHWYGAAAYSDDNTVYLFRGATEIASAPAQFVKGALLRLEAQANILTVTYNGVVLITYEDDDAGAILDAGLPGLYGDADGGVIFDDFECCSKD